MKLKALLLACAVAGAGASFALADDGHGAHNASGTTTTGTTATGTTATGTTETTTTGTTTTSTTPSDCQRLELKGTLASVSASSLVLTVTKANDAGQALVGHPATIAVGPTTRVSWEGTGTLTGPNVGDSARVNALSCGGSTTLTAKNVSARGPKAGEHGNDEHGNSGSHDAKKH